MLQISSLVMLRWIIRVGRPFDSSREMIHGLISPAVRTSGWLYGPGTTHHASDRITEVWLTVVTRVDDASVVQDSLSDFLGSPPTVETTQDALLVADGEWYRVALQEVTHVALDVIDIGDTIPVSEYEAFESPSDTVLPLRAFLNEVSGTYRRACTTYESTETFWLGFFRRGPTPGLSRAGRWLWNLAG